MKKAKLSDYYKIGDENFPIGLSASMIDVPLLKAMGDGIKELELTPVEFQFVMQHGVSNYLYHHIFYDGV